MTDYLIITGDNCSYCDKAKATLADAGLSYVEINLMEAPEIYQVMTVVGQKTVPLVLKVIGGSDELTDSLINV